MEPLTRRIGLHIHALDQERIIAFYRDLVGLRIAKDIVLFGGERWVTLVKEDNIGIQFHIHPPKPQAGIRPFCIELSIPCGECELSKKRFDDAGYPITEFSLPYAAGFHVVDPIGNEITLSWWGELETDDEAGWDTEFLDYRNCTAPITRNG